ncbi:MAG TPA: bifunctional oligoribonuclease/PAP phosphatase NrnA [Clostridia bacterium]|nr:bifunctional oligoribonuclease/PAP phosphatase NrnA [Clostridia bacterium]
MFSDIVMRINEAKRILIIPHIMPDGDTIGSSIALKLALQKIGKTVCVHNIDPLPDDISFIGTEYIADATDFVASADLVIALDSSDKNRLSVPFEDICEFDIINIDHHRTNENYGLLNLVLPDASATGEIIYNLIVEMGIEMDAEIAENLYIAISTDTGRFLYSNTHPETMKIAAKLLETGIDIDNLNIQLYQNQPYDKVMFESEAMLSMKLYYKRKLSVVCLEKSLFEKYGLNHTASDGIVERARNIRGVDISFLLKEVDDSVKVSMRSKGDFDVSKIAGIFGGGGHKNAAGFITIHPLSEISKRLIEEAGKQYGF